MGRVAGVQVCFSLTYIHNENVPTIFALSLCPEPVASSEVDFRF